MSDIGITDEMLIQMREQVAELLPDLCVIKSQSYISDGAGGGSILWTPVAGGTVACRLDPLSTQQRQKDVFFANKPTEKVAYTLTLPYDAPLEPEDQITAKGHDYRILGINDQHSNNVSVRAFAERAD